jgi:hypothetical protein
MKVRYYWYRSFSHWGMFNIITEVEDDGMWFDVIDQKWYSE